MAFQCLWLNVRCSLAKYFRIQNHRKNSTVRIRSPMVFGTSCSHGGSCTKPDCITDHNDNGENINSEHNGSSSYSGYFAVADDTTSHDIKYEPSEYDPNREIKVEPTDYCPWKEQLLYNNSAPAEGGYYASYAPVDDDDIAKAGYSGSYVGTLATPSSHSSQYSSSYHSSGLQESTSATYSPFEMYDPEQCSSSYAGSTSYYGSSQYFPNMSSCKEPYTPEEYVPEDYKVSTYDPGRSEQSPEPYIPSNVGKYSPRTSPEEYVPEDYVPVKQEGVQSSHASSYACDANRSSYGEHEYDPVNPSLSGTTNTYEPSACSLMTYKPSKLPSKRSFGGEDNKREEPKIKKRCSSPDPDFSVFSKSRLPADLADDEILSRARRAEYKPKPVEPKKALKKTERMPGPTSVLSLKKKDIGCMSREQRAQMATQCIKTVAQLNEEIERIERGGSSSTSDANEERDIKAVHVESSLTKKQMEKPRKVSSSANLHTSVKGRSSLDDLFGGSGSTKTSSSNCDARETKPARAPSGPVKIDKNKKLTPAQLEAAKKLMTRPQTTGKRANVKQGVSNAKEQLAKRAQMMQSASSNEKLQSKAVSESLAHRSTSSAKSVEKSAQGQRIAHQTSATKNTASPLSVPNSQIPPLLRLKYVNTFLHECRKIASSLPDALEMAQNEEKTLCVRASTKSGYVSAAVNVLKNLRAMTSKSAKARPGVDSSSGVSHSEVLAGRHNSDISVGVTRSARGTNKSQNLTESEFYEALADNFLLTDQQFEENCYPLWDEKVDTPKVRFGGQEPAKGKRFVPDDEMERLCSRCGKEYSLTARGGYARADDCVYHFNRAFRTKKNGTYESRYNCCGSDLTVKGCCVSECHVTESLRELEMHTFVESPAPTGLDDPRSRKVYALDCEMVYTVWGPALARLSVVDLHDDLVLDLIVKPKDLVVDCNTRFSGLTIEQLEQANETIENAHERLFELINQETILIGHSLESDLKALRLVHPRVVDTAVVFPHRLGPPYKRALRTLSSEILSKIIQEEVSGHDSKEDASACMQLMIYKVREIS
uniref:Exonuclease domain-containing protein n=1 Tax=Steinernema glaseri TaxID=37863 RepID=A0A1I7ZF31_9BILA